MTINEYQNLAQRTSREQTWIGKVDNGVMGLCGEVGECIDIYKKFKHQGHKLDKAHLAEEVGDTIWYAAELATGLGMQLEDIMINNINKLKKRYPDGFDEERSINREE